MDIATETPAPKKRASPAKPKKPKAPKAPSKVASRQVGRPSLYTPELGELIAKRLADGETLRSVCRDAGMPDERRVRAWAADPGHPFSDSYARAREVGYLSMADQLVAIADDMSKDWTTRETKSGKTIRVVEVAINRRDCSAMSENGCSPSACRRCSVIASPPSTPAPAVDPSNSSRQSWRRARRIALLFEEAAASGKAEQLRRLPRGNSIMSDAAKLIKSFAAMCAALPPEKLAQLDRQLLEATGDRMWVPNPGGQAKALASPS